jgi:hypothetical protein
MTHFVSHLEGAIDGTRFEPGQLLGTHAGKEKVSGPFFTCRAFSDPGLQKASR